MQFFQESHWIRSQYVGFLRKCGRFGFILPIPDAFTAFTCTISLPVHTWRGMFSRAFQEQTKIDPSGAMCNIFFLESHWIRSQYAGFLRKCGKFGLILPIADTFTAFTCTIGLPSLSRASVS